MYLACPPLKPSKQTLNDLPVVQFLIEFLVQDFSIPDITTGFTNSLNILMQKDFSVMLEAIDAAPFGSGSKWTVSQLKFLG